MKAKGIFWSNNRDVNVKIFMSSQVDSELSLMQAHSQDELIYFLENNRDVDIVLTIADINDVSSLYTIHEVQRMFDNIPIVSVLDNGSNVALVNSIDKLMSLFHEGAKTSTHFDENIFLEKNYQNSQEKKIRLTRRQVDVLKLISIGKSNKEIARDLKLSEGTVKTHCMAIFKGIGVTNRTQAAMMAESLIKDNTFSFGCRE